MTTDTSAVTTAAQTSATSATAAAKTSLAADYTTFLTLLTTQLKNQDPQSPLDTNSFTQQLVQMTGVQQQLLSNDLLQKLVNQGSTGLSGGVNLIGKTVTATSPNANLTNGAAHWSYNLDHAAQSGTLQVLDASGAVVWQGAAPDLSSGAHDFTWDGSSTTGSKRTSGAYTLNVVATDTSGAAVPATLSVQGMVTGVEQANGQTLLDLGTAKVNMNTVTAVKQAA